MFPAACSMLLPDIWTHWNSKTKPPDPVLAIGRSPKSTHFRRDRSFPSTGGVGVSTQTLGPDNLLGHRPSSHGLSLPQAAGVGVTNHSVCLCENIRNSVDLAHARLSKTR